MPYLFGSVHVYGQALWQLEQCVMNSALPALAFSRSILPNTSSGHCGGARRASWFSTRCSSRMRGVRPEQPFGGRFGAQINGHEDAHGLGQIAEDRILLHSAPLRPQSLRSIPKERRLGRCDSALTSSRECQAGRLTRRLTIMAMASMRDGPQVVGVTRTRVRNSCTLAASPSKRLRKLALGLRARRSQPRRQTIEFGGSDKVACIASSRASI